MNYRTDHPDWPLLTSDMLENKKRSGSNWICTCPVCHTHHLSVHREKGIFKCWYIGCEFHGILEDYRDEPVNQPYRQSHGSSKHSSSKYSASNYGASKQGNRRSDTDADGWKILWQDDDNPQPNDKP